ncbi:MAG: EF-hand domain-containing protein [Rubrivivax sp.]
MDHGFGGDAQTTTTTTTPTTPDTPPSPPTVAEVVERVLTQFDANDDDAITLDEVLALLDPDGTHATVAEQAKAAFAQVDGDGSGAIGSAELTTAVAALDTDGDGSLERGEKAADDSGIGVLLHGHGPHGPGGHGGPGGPRDAGGVAVATLVAHALARFDADDSGAVSLAELVAEFGEHGRTDAQAEADAAAVLALADTNADQSLGSDELTAAVAKADSDADGLVDWAEFVALPADYALLMGLPHGPHGDPQG